MRTLFFNIKGTGAAGYTLIELLVVVAIIGIMATQVVMQISSPVQKVKSSAFRMRNDFNLARAEAVNRNEDVQVDFLFDTDIDGDGDQDDGYRVWVDDAPAGEPAGDGVYTTGNDSLIKEVPFVDDVEFYDDDLRATGGPDKTPAGGALTVTDGVSFSFGNNWFTMQPDGTANWAGTVYIYIPDPGGPTGMRAGPYAVVLSTVGRIRIQVWHRDQDAWSSK